MLKSSLKEKKGDKVIRKLKRDLCVSQQAGHLLRHCRGEIKMMEYGDIISSGNECVKGAVSLKGIFTFR